ncbi:MAG TPA: hypothetical protein VGK16_02180, partial [Candidatus Limnocylindrales bacterium]
MTRTEGSRWSRRRQRASQRPSRHGHGDSAPRRSSWPAERSTHPASLWSRPPDRAPQLYRWDINSGALTQLTDAPAGRILGYLTPDARWVAWLDDTAGDEIGHWAVAPVEGGAPVDLTPGLAPYASEAIAFSRRGGRVAMVTAADDRLNLMAGQLGNDGRVDGLRSLHGTHAGLGEVALSSDGRLA